MLYEIGNTIECFKDYVTIIAANSTSGIMVM